MNLRRLVTTVTIATAALLTLAVPAHAEGPVRVEIDPATHPTTSWTCDDGAVVSANVTGGWIVMGARTAADGTFLVTMNMHYDLALIDTSDGTVLEGRGTMRLVVDTTTGHVTEAGNTRSLTLPGLGAVLHQAGRFVYAPDATDPVSSAGRYLDAAADGEFLCGYFGHDL